MLEPFNVNLSRRKGPLPTGCIFNLDSTISQKSYFPKYVSEEFQRSDNLKTERKPLPEQTELSAYLKPFFNLSQKRLNHREGILSLVLTY
jgi:hypothetical protein